LPCATHLKEAKLIDFISGGKGFRVRTRYQILTPCPNPIPDPTQHPFPKPFPEPIHYKEKIKIKTKNNNFEKIKIDERFSKREYIAGGSDFD
jgi:hypothetical protein